MSANHRFMLRAFLLLFLVVGAGTLALLSTTSSSGAGDSPPPALPAESSGLIQRVERLEQELTRLSLTNPPVGSVIAYAGEWPPKRNNGDVWSEAELGWFLCDGRTLREGDYKELFDAVGTAHGRPSEGTFCLPDYQGQFLRGVAHGKKTDPDRDTRKPSSAGGNSGDKVGSMQEQATKTPNNPLKTKEDGGHTHGSMLDAPGDDSKIPRWFHNDRDANFWKTNSSREGVLPSLVDSRLTNAPGVHKHDLEGGDTETRPVNKAVNWIIKFR